MRGKRRRFLVLSMFAALSLAALCLLGSCTREEPARREVLRIGLLAPMSGNPMRFTAQRAAQEQVDRLNAAGGLDLGGRKVPVKLIVEDTGGQAERVMAAMGRLIRQERVQVVIGPYFSREAIPAGAAADAAQVLMLSPAASNPLVTQGRRYVFRACLVDSDQGRVLARLVHEDMGLKRVGVLFDEGDAYSSGLAGFFRDAMNALPGSRVQLESYPTGTQDFSAQLERLRAWGMQALVLPNFLPDLSRQLAQARAAGFKGAFIGGDSWDTDRGFHSLPEAQGGRYSAEYAAEAVDPAMLKDAEDISRAAGVDLTKNVALTLDALALVFAAARKVGGIDSASLREGLLALRGFTGLTGSIRFENDGDPVRGVAIMEITGGRPRLLKNLAPGG